MSTGEIIHQVEKIDNLEDSKKQIEEIFAAEVSPNFKESDPEAYEAAVKSLKDIL